MAMADDEEHDTTSSKNGAAWGTLEELLLACAISRHGTKSWDFIAVEVQKRATSRIATNRKSCYNNFLTAFTPHSCEQRYHDLRCRFEVTGGGGRNDNDDSGKSDGESDAAGGRDLPERLPFMIDELRKLRIEELRREVQRHDVSIVSLESKVQRLEEERVRAEDEADLRTRTDRRSAGDERRGRLLDGSLDEAAGESVSRDPSDEPEDRSLNESRSTSHKAAQVKDSNQIGRTNVNRNGGPEPDPVQTEPDFEPDKEFSAEKAVGRTSHAARLGNLGELRASVSELKREAKESEVTVDLQSLQKRKRRGWRRGNGVGSSRNERAEAFSPANGRMDKKSQPLIKFLEILRSHKHGLVFQRRLPSQETHKYRKLIRQHMDVETVNSKLEQGVYSNCHQMFYRDLLLVFTNALLFFRKSSTQYLAAGELRSLVTGEIASRKPSLGSEPPPTDRDAPANIVVCRRRRDLTLIKPPANNGQELEAVKNKIDHRRKDTPMKLKRDRLNLRTGTDNRCEEEDEQEQAINVKHKRTKHDSSSSKKGEKGEVMEVGKKKVTVRKMDEGSRTRLSGRRSISNTAKKKPGR